ncbi:MAG: 2-oxo-4-hydroxy-4-carboxy-5-ureidoimidazoline decarboxylase [Actinomycetia bacterium]|nr:2-oxo-4-hydroxy-4-carboxy-5-ureidoimidazoline decarboxylase [Actinomycetes bacterium]
MDDYIGLDALNAMPADELRTHLLGVCASTRWADEVVRGRPYASVADLYARSDRAVRALDDDALGEALAGHPRIGDRPDSAVSAREQASMADAATSIADRIRAGNLAYEERFGHVYLVCASGKSPDELLAILESRLHNDPATERGVVLDELAAINRLRLGRLFAP